MSETVTPPPVQPDPVTPAPAPLVSLPVRQMDLTPTGPEPTVPSNIRFETGSTADLAGWVKDWTAWHTQAMKAAIQDHARQLATPTGQLVALQGAQQVTADGLTAAEAANTALQVRLNEAEASRAHVFAQLQYLESRLAQMLKAASAPPA